MNIRKTAQHTDAILPSGYGINNVFLNFPTLYLFSVLLQFKSQEKKDADFSGTGSKQIICLNFTCLQYHINLSEKVGQ